jgi:CubicO group peptidase (beta-lactamase class C family)
VLAEARTATDVLAGSVDAVLDREAEKGFSGIVLVGYDDEIVYERGVGFANIEPQLRFDGSTVVSIGSITKQFTGAAIVKAESLGYLSVGDRLGDHLADVPSDKLDITVHHLLTHTAGLESDFAGDFDTHATRDWYVRAALTSPLRTVPGSAYHYSNAGFSLAAAILELATDVPYERFLHQHLFEPAGMTWTGYLIPAFDEARIAHGYLAGEDWGTVVDKPWDSDGPYWALRGNGGIQSTARDMFAWHLALEHGAVLDSIGLRRLQAPYFPESDHYDDAVPAWYGYGWSLTRTPWGTRSVRHDGGDDINLATVRRFPDDGVVIFMASNVAEHQCTDFAHDVVSCVFSRSDVST